MSISVKDPGPVLVSTDRDSMRTTESGVSDLIFKSQYNGYRGDISWVF